MKINKSYVWAGVMSLAIAGWLASGELMSSTTPAEEPVEEKTTSLFRVEVQTMTAGTRQPELIIRGRTEALRNVEVRARTAGIVEEIARNEGDPVKSGDLLCRLDMGAKTAKLAEEKAKLASTKLELDVANKLLKQQFAARTKQAAEQANYDAAKAAVEQMEREISYTSISAPINGVIDTRPAEPGSFLQMGSVCARVLVLDPLLILGQVSERDVAKLKPGMEGSARLVTGETVQGTIRHIASSADATTRTFRVELEVPNPGNKLRDGVTSELRIPLDADKAHKFSPALLALDDEGRIGVRIIENKEVVRFVPVKILGDEKDGVWVSGLPETVTLITTGQEYVVDGQKVDAVFRDSPALVEKSQ